MWIYQHPSFSVHQMPVLNDNYLYIIETQDSLIAIDPAIPQPVITLSEACHKPLTFILNTHHHWDHTDANLALKKHFNCRIIASAYDAQRIPGMDQAATESMHLNTLKVKVIDVPGHTLGHIVYLIEDALFSGDTLFGAGCGRLFEGTAKVMWKSLAKLAVLKPETKVYCAHEYTLMNLKFARTVDKHNTALKQRISNDTRQRMQKKPTIPSSIGLELATNPFLRPLDHQFCHDYAAQHKSSMNACDIFTDIRQRRDCYS